MVTIIVIEGWYHQQMAILDDSGAKGEVELVLGFYDLTRYLVWASSLPPADLLALMDGYFDLTAGLLRASGGEFVKAIGDAGFAVFPADAAETAVEAFLQVRSQGDAWLAGEGIDSEAQVRLHLGRVAVGLVAGRPDVYGDAVNRAATLRGGDFVVTEALFVRLGPDLRARFTPGPETGSHILSDTS